MHIRISENVHISEFIETFMKIAKKVFRGLHLTTLFKRNDSNKNWPFRDNSLLLYDFLFFFPTTNTICLMYSFQPLNISTLEYMRWPHTWNLCLWNGWYPELHFATFIKHKALSAMKMVWNKRFSRNFMGMIHSDVDEKDNVKGRAKKEIWNVQCFLSWSLNEFHRNCFKVKHIISV